MNILACKLPCVPHLVPLSPWVAWSGKWSCNWSTDTVKLAGGPWNSLEDACAGILATGLYQLRPGSESNPHFDRISNYRLANASA